MLFPPLSDLFEDKSQSQTHKEVNTYNKKLVKSAMNPSSAIFNDDEDLLDLSGDGSADFEIDETPASSTVAPSQLDDTPKKPNRGSIARMKPSPAKKIVLSVALLLFLLL